MGSSLRRIALLATLVSGCNAAAPVPSSTAPSASPVASASASSSIDPATARREDLDQLVKQLVAIHPDPFLDEGEPAFRARVDAIAARAGQRTDAGFLVDVMGLLGHRDRDGHGGAWAMAQQGERVHVVPVWLREFPDGLRVVAARAPYQDLVGGIVTAVGGTPVDQAVAAVSPLVPADNDSNRRANLPMYLLVEEVVDELGIRQTGASRLSLRFEDGTSRDADPDPLPIGAYRDWLFDLYGGYPMGMPPDDDATRDRQHRDLSFWTDTLPDGTLYVAYEQVQARANGESDVPTIISLARKVTQSAAGMVIDMRVNPGGDNTTYWPLRDAVRKRAIADPGAVAILTSRETFSAAGNFVTDLKVGEGGDGILLVGEPPGGGLNQYGDVAIVTLEHSGIVVHIAHSYQEKAPGDDRLQIEPEVPVEATWADVQAGRDAVLGAALAAMTDREAP